ncbi:sentrin-specific protease 2-like [Brienomyrus brachyistius]|uniref:sentrin-specific protease 2-like n=1 Tax=Brienomyrus brachyistius TaxID=42636 RepID=UPI0020B26200|nr:sentrin-specific protease 2-like [Brienomyrus brachyistius]
MMGAAEIQNPRGCLFRPAPAGKGIPLLKLLRNSSDLHDAWAGKDVHVLLSKIGPYKIFYWDIKKTGPHQQLESEVINAFLRLLVIENNKVNMSKAVMIDSYEMTAIWMGRTSKVKMSPMDFQTVLGIVNVHYHWMLMVISPHEKKCVFLDPMGETSGNIKRCSEATRAFMRKKGCNVSRWPCSALPHERQRDGSSCGILTLKFAECILKGVPINILTTEEAVNQMRQSQQPVSLL